MYQTNYYIHYIFVKDYLKYKNRKDLDCESISTTRTTAKSIFSCLLLFLLKIKKITCLSIVIFKHPSFCYFLIKISDCSSGDSHTSTESKFIRLFALIIFMIFDWDVHA